MDSPEFFRRDVLEVERYYESVRREDSQEAEGSSGTKGYLDLEYENQRNALLKQRLQFNSDAKTSLT